MARKSAAKKQQDSNVIQFRSSDFDLVCHRARAGWVALDVTIDRLSAAKKRTVKAYKKALVDAKKAYEKGSDFKKKSEDALKGMVEEDRLAVRIAELRDASLECRSAGERAASPQGDMFDPGKGAEIAGMGWASAATRLAIYSCLYAMDKAGEQLDPHQTDLFLDLGGAGFEALDFGLSAAEAVEDEGSEADPEPEGEDDGDVGF